MDRSTVVQQFNKYQQQASVGQLPADWIARLAADTGMPTGSNPYSWIDQYMGANWLETAAPQVRNNAVSAPTTPLAQQAAGPAPVAPQVAPPAVQPTPMAQQAAGPVPTDPNVALLNQINAIRQQSDTLRSQGESADLQTQAARLQQFNQLLAQAQQQLVVAGKNVDAATAAAVKQYLDQQQAQANAVAGQMKTVQAQWQPQITKAQAAIDQVQQQLNAEPQQADVTKAQAAYDSQADSLQTAIDAAQKNADAATANAQTVAAQKGPNSVYAVDASRAADNAQNALTQAQGQLQQLKTNLTNAQGSLQTQQQADQSRLTALQQNLASVQATAQNNIDYKQWQVSTPAQQQQIANAGLKLAQASGDPEAIRQAQVQTQVANQAAQGVQQTLNTLKNPATASFTTTPDKQNAIQNVSQATMAQSFVQQAQKGAQETYQADVTLAEARAKAAKQEQMGMIVMGVLFAVVGGAALLGAAGVGAGAGAAAGEAAGAGAAAEGAGIADAAATAGEAYTAALEGGATTAEALSSAAGEVGVAGTTDATFSGIAGVADQVGLESAATSLSIPTTETGIMQGFVTPIAEGATTAAPELSLTGGTLATTAPGATGAGLGLSSGGGLGLTAAGGGGLGLSVPAATATWDAILQAALPMAAAGGGLAALASGGGGGGAAAAPAVPGATAPEITPGADALATSGANAPNAAIPGVGNTANLAPGMTSADVASGSGEATIGSGTGGLGGQTVGSTGGLTTGTGGTVGVGNPATILNTGDLPAGAVEDAAGNVTLSNGVTVPAQQANALGGQALASLQSVDANVATQALAAQSAASAPLTPGGVLNTLNQIRSGVGLANTAAALLGGGQQQQQHSTSGGGGMATNTIPTSLLNDLSTWLGIDPNLLSGLAQTGMTAAQIAVLQNLVQQSKTAYATTPQQTAANQYQTGLAGSATALQQGPSNPQFQQLMQTQHNLIMQNYQKDLNAVQNTNREQIARSGIGFLNPERTNQMVAGSLAQAEEGATAQAQSQIMQALQGAVTAGTPVGQSLQQAAQFGVNQNIGQYNKEAGLRMAQVGAPTALINSLFGTSQGSNNPTPATAGTTAGGAGAQTAQATSLLGMIAGATGTVKSGLTNLYNSLFGSMPAATTGTMGAVSGTDLGTGIGDAASSLTGGIGSGAAMAPDLASQGGSAITDLLTGGGSAAASDAGMLPEIASSAPDIGSSVFDFFG